MLYSATIDKRKDFNGLSSAYNTGDVGAGDGVCDLVEPGESILGFLLGTSSDRSLTSLSRLRLFSDTGSFLTEEELLLPLLCNAGLDWKTVQVVLQ